MQSLADHFMNELIDEVILGVAYETHRSLVQGTLFWEDSSPSEVDKGYKVINKNGLDIFGKPICSKKNVEFICPCPNCDRSIAANRFAPHLEKCMGMGRNSSRIASQKIAKTRKTVSNGNLPLERNDKNYVDVDLHPDLNSSLLPTRRRGRRATTAMCLRSKNFVNPSEKSSQTTVPVRSYSMIRKRKSRCKKAMSVCDNRTRNENIRYTLTVWEKHIKRILSQQNKNNTPVLSSSYELRNGSTRPPVQTTDRRTKGFTKRQIAMRKFRLS